MTRKTSRVSFRDGMQHPEEGMLLAYLRGQQLEDHARVLRHLEQEHCSQCLGKLHELKQVSAKLDVLGEMRSYQSYPELTVADTYTRMQNALNRQSWAKKASKAYGRRRSRQSALRLMSKPTACGLALRFTMALFVFASYSGRSSPSFPSTGDTKPGHTTLTIVVPLHASATSGANSQEPAMGTPSAPGPHKEVCSTSADMAHMQPVICGFNFDSKHKATVVVYVHGKGSFSIHALAIDRHGKFQAGWPLVACSNVPTLIKGNENTGTKQIKVKLPITSFGSCSVPANTTVGKPSGFSPGPVSQ